jgi:hypothetical protein
MSKRLVNWHKVTTLLSEEDTIPLNTVWTMLEEIWWFMAWRGRVFAGEPIIEKHLTPEGNIYNVHALGVFVGKERARNAYKRLEYLNGHFIKGDRINPHKQALIQFNLLDYLRCEFIQI